MLEKALVKMCQALAEVWGGEHTYLQAHRCGLQTRMVLVGSSTGKMLGNGGKPQGPAKYPSSISVASFC